MINKIINIFINLPKNFCLMLIYFYRACISPMFPACCRFKPTCSEYALECFTRFGFKRGIILSFKRFIKCHPFGKKGYDPVPDK